MPLKQSEIEARLTRMSAMSSEGYGQQVLELARKTLAEMPARPDPRLLGWVRFYEFKALHLLEAWKEFDERFRKTGWAVFAMGAKNAAWVHTVAAEAAERLGDAEEVVRRCEACYHLRLEDQDPISAVQALHTACLLLGRLGRPDLNTPFAERMLEAGQRFGAAQALIRGLHQLADNFERSHRTTVRRRLADGQTALARLKDSVFAAEARRMLARLRRLLR
jgi:hypothetical protein